MIDYNYYETVYYGDKVGNDKRFNRLAGKAERTIANIINGNLYEISDIDILDMIKFTMCELIDHYDDVEEIGNIKQEKIGEKTTSYFGLVNAESIIHNGLAGTDLVITHNYRPLGRL